MGLDLYGSLRRMVGNNVSLIIKIIAILNVVVKLIITFEIATRTRKIYVMWIAFNTNFVNVMPNLGALITYD